jgi:hypothetical protein
MSVAIQLRCTDPDSAQTLTLARVSGPARGTLGAIDQSTQQVTYTAPMAFFGTTDSFTYRASDGTATSNTATVSIRVVGFF